MTDVKRYNPNHNEINAMNEREFGDYVLFFDYKSLLAKNAKLKDRNIYLEQVNIEPSLGYDKLKADAVREAADKLFYQGSEHHMFCYKYANKLEAGE